ncbi:MAG: hypothetical protein HY961_05695 [Ignavibacteriae bacterium]|nr:hypothetical protein [Ignavibacteriota bacterium]
MHSLIDYIGSMITGGAVFIMMVSYYTSISATAIMQVFNSTTQEDVTSITEVIEYDFRKAGYRVTDSVAFATIDSNSVALRGDYDNNGTMDTVKYWLSSELIPGAESSSAKTLYRREGNSTVRLTTNGVSRFRIWYYDRDGNATSAKKSVQFARIALHVEGKLSYDGERASAYWERLLKPQNVR